jgi:Putative zinc-finger
MNHLDAIKSHVGERYLLNELAPAERAAFEEHYFECAECAADVKVGVMFLENARAVLREDSTMTRVTESKRPSSGWVGWLQPAFLVSALTCAMVFIFYQNTMLIPRLKSSPQIVSQAQVLQAFSLIPSNSRGPGVQAFHASPGRPFSLFFDVPPQRSFSSYRCDVQTAGGADKISVEVSSQQAQETIQVLVPGSLLEAGDYVLVVRGEGSSAADAQEIVRYPFSLQYVK